MELSRLGQRISEGNICPNAERGGEIQVPMWFPEAAMAATLAQPKETRDL
jgi:hypothetical protein